MRLASLCLFALCAAVMASGCTTTTDDSGGTNNGPQGYTPVGNGKRMNEGDACKMLADAISDAALKMSSPCTVTVKQCPDYIRRSVPGQEACLQYDEGTILGCVEFYHTFTKCSEFDTRPCTIGYFAGSAPAGCPDTDAGVDAQAEASTDAQTQEDVVTESSTDDAATDDVVTDDVVTPDDVATSDVSEQDAAGE